MISEQISLDLLRTYVSVCRQGSLSRVAAQSGRTQSALSMQMRRLEGLLDRTLFQRTGRGVVPTAEGEVFLGYATRILALGDEALARVRQVEISGAVSIGVAEEVATSALPAALGRLHRAYPDLRLDVTVEHSVALGRLWSDDRLDVMIAPSSVVAADAVAAWSIELQWTCAADYVAGANQPLELVAFPVGCLWRRRMTDALAADGREFRVAFTSQSVAGKQAAIESGLGVGLLPPEAIRPGSMRVLKGASGIPAPFTVQYGLYTHDRRTPVVDAAVAVLLQALPVQAALSPTTPA